jgi:hypothetical protein
MESRKPLLLVITSHEYYQSYFESGFIDRIASHYSISILTIRSLRHLDFLGFPVYTYSKHPFILSLIFEGLNLKNTRRLSGQLSGFRLRLYRVNFSFGYIRAHGAREGLNRLFFELLSSLFASIYSKKSNSLFTRIAKSADYIKSLTILKPKLILIPCMATNLEVFLASWYKASTDNNVIDICLVDNWDNLCSKSTFLLHPSAVGVYGRQSFLFASRIHGIQDEKIFIWGSPRYTLYQSHSSVPHVSRNVLYCGTSCFYDEVNDIQRYFQAATNYVDHDTKFLHFPHPWRTVPRNLKSYAKCAYSDPNIECIERNGIRNLSSIASLISSSWFVISGPTSLVLEALLLSKKVIVSIPHCRASIQSPAEIFFGYDHFSGLESIPLLRVCSDQSDLASVLSWATNQATTADIDESHRLLRYFVDLSQDPIYNLYNHISLHN